jgi:2-(1,2-epoxy-1,2-dihydrophenyl)acetyl-CoA isomerase
VEEGKAVSGTDEWSPGNAARSLYAALCTGDRIALDALLHPEFVGETTPGLPLDLGGRYEGPHHMRRQFWGRIARTFDLAAEPTEMTSLADGRLLVTGTYVGTVRRTGTKLDAGFVHILRFADRQILGLVQITDSQRWWAALAEPAAPTVVGPSSRDLTQVTLSFDGSGVARLRLARPEAANSIDPTMVADIAEAVERCATEPGVRALLITGEGDRFCGGGDIKYFAGLGDGELGPVLDDMITIYHRGLLRLSNLPFPVVCAVQGAVAGGGLGLLFASDIVIAAAGTKFAMGYPALGLVSDGGSSWHLPRLVGPVRAAAMFLDNRALDAGEALTYGLVSEVVDGSQLHDRAEETALRLAAGPTRALGSMRRLLRQAWTTPLPQQLDDEMQAMTEVCATADAAEGVAAFAAKRRPTFRGR